jgi:hypothetical protein
MAGQATLLMLAAQLAVSTVLLFPGNAHDGQMRAVAKTGVVGPWGLPRISTGADAEILGHVVEPPSERPVAGAIVLLGPWSDGPATGDGAGWSRRVMTAKDGRFRFSNVRPGRYRIVVDAPGFLGSGFGQVEAGGQDEPLDVGATSVTAVRILAWRFPALGGVVVDDRGEPIAGVTVSALRRLIVTSQWHYRLASRARTNDLGAFRFWRLAPGTYLFSVSHTPSEDSGRSGGHEDANVGFGPQYYQLADAIHQALPVTLEAGERREDIEFRLQPGNGVTVSGVVMAAGARIARARIDLLPASVDGTAGPALMSTESARDGSFRFLGVPPGGYVVRATATAPPEADSPMLCSGSNTLWSDAEAFVRDDPVTDLALTLQRGIRLTGTVEGLAPDSPLGGRGHLNLSVVLARVDGFFSGIIPFSRIGEDGRFCAMSYPGGSYFLAVKSTMPGVVLGVATHRGVDVTEKPLTLGTQDLDDMRVTLTTASAAVSGTVRSATGAPSRQAFVVLLPLDIAQWVQEGKNPRRVRTGAVAASGGFRFAELPPGDYRLAALPAARADDWMDGEHLSRVARDSLHIRLEVGHMLVQDLRIGDR